MVLFTLCFSYYIFASKIQKHSVTLMFCFPTSLQWMIATIVHFMQKHSAEAEFIGQYV